MAEYQLNIPDNGDCFCGKVPCRCDKIDEERLEQHKDSMAHDRMEEDWLNDNSDI